MQKGTKNYLVFFVRFSFFIFYDKNIIFYMQILTENSFESFIEQKQTKTINNFSLYYSYKKF